MSGLHRRVIVDGPFDRTLWWLIEALARDGFTIRTTPERNPMANMSRGCRKHIVLEATPRGVTAAMRKPGPSASLPLPCGIAVYEVSAHQTALVVPDALAPATCDRITRTLDGVAHRQAPSMAVA